MGEEDAGVDEGPVAELWENFKEAVDAGRFDEEAEERAGGAGQSPTIALESSLLCEEADAAGGLAFEVPPGVAADAARDDDLRLAVGEERQDALVSRQAKSLTRGLGIGLQGAKVFAEARAAFACESEDGEIGGGVDVHLRLDGAGKFPDGETRVLLERAGQGVIALERRDRVENTFADGEGGQIGGEGVVGESDVAGERTGELAEVVGAEERDAAAAEIDDGVERVAANEVGEAGAGVEGARIEIEVEARGKILVACVVGGEDGSRKRAAGGSGRNGIECRSALGAANHLLDRRGTQISEEDDQGGGGHRGRLPA